MENWLITKYRVINLDLYDGNILNVPDEQYLFVGIEEEAKDIVEKKNALLLEPHIASQRKHLAKAVQQLEEVSEIEECENPVLDRERRKLVTIQTNKVNSIKKRLSTLEAGGIFLLNEAGWSYDKLETLDEK